jgi:uracil-DNA glycosylase family 4
VSHCEYVNKCPLGLCANIRTHGMEPTGSEQPLLYIVGEAPGSVEDQQGIPFVGPAGDLLREILRRLGIDLAYVRINNAVRCAPWNEKKQKIGTPTAKHLEYCLPSLMVDIAKTKPKVVLTLGSIPTKAVTKTRAKITTIRGSIQSVAIGGDTYPVIPSLHPSFIRRNGMDVTLMTFLMGDIKKAWDFATGARKPEVTSYQGRDYGMLKTLEEVQGYVDLLVAKCAADPNMYITADFEAGRLEDWRPDNPVIGLGISYGPHQGRFIPLQHWQSPLGGQVAEVAKILAPIADLPISNQNVKFDRLWAKRRLGMEWNNLRFDTMLGHHCKFAGTRPNDLETMGGLYLQEPAWSHKLKDSVERARDHIKAQKKAAKKAKDEAQLAYWTEWEVLGKMGAGYAVAPLEDIALYCCIDVDVAWRLTPVVEKMLVDSDLYDVYVANYHNGLIPFGDMQYDGISINNTVVAQLKQDLPGEMAKIELELGETKYAKQALTLLGKDPATDSINLNSPPQVACLVYDAMKMPPARMRGKSQRTTESEQLTQLVGMCKRKGKKTAQKVLEKISEWRSLEKFLGSYVLSNEVCQDSDGLVHPTWNLMGTRTGRMSADTPPVHSAPKKHGLRKQYKSRWSEDGGILVGADESQVELRIFASIAEDLNLIKFYCEMVGADLHRYMASLLFNVPYEHVKPEQRSIAKTCVFASLYGGGAGNLAAQTGMTMGEAKVIHARFTSIVAIEAFKDLKTAELMNFGYVTTPFGRCLPISIGNTEGALKHAIRQALNTPIQSAASDIVAQAIMRARTYMRQMGLRSKIVIFHHDAIYWDVFPGELFTILWLANRVLVEEPAALYPWLRVPLKIGIEFGKSWGDKIEVDSFDSHSLTIKFKAEKDEDTPEFHTRYYNEVVSQFEGPMGKVLQMQNIQSEPREIVALVTPRMAG